MKKVLALTLVLVLAISMSTVAFAAGKKIDRNDWDYDKNLVFNQAASGNLADDAQDGRKDTVFFINLNSNLTGISAGTVATGSSTDPIHKDDLKASDFDVRIKWTKGSSVFDDIDVDYAKSKVTISYASNIMTTGDIEFKYTVYAVINGRSMSSGSDAPVIEGTYVPEAFNNWEDSWFEFDGQNYIKPSEFIRNMEFSFSDDVSVWGRALKGVKYYGYANEDVSDADQDVMIKYSAVVGVYHLKQINVKAVSDYVTLNNADSTLFVYDGDLNYLGKGNEKLAYADTYYLAAAQLDVDSGDEPIEEDDDEDDDWDEPTGYNPNGGGDDLYPENPHDNPGTGK